MTRTGHTGCYQLPVSRRSVLQAGAGLCSLGVLPGFARAAESTLIGTGCLTILYIAAEDGVFDYQYCREHHLPLIQQRFGEAIDRIELRRPLPTAEPATSGWAAVSNIWIRDAELFAAASHRHGEELASDVTAFTRGRLIAQPETVLAEAFSARQATDEGQTCITLLYPRETGATFDAAWYRDRHLPLLMACYGSEAIRRIEVHEGPVGGRFLATVNLYIENQAAFDAATALNREALDADTGNFSSVLPTTLVAEILGIGATIPRA